MITLLRRYLLHNFGLKVISLGMAVFLWILIASAPELETSINVPVEFHNMPKDLEIISDQEPNVYVQVKGSPGKVRGISRPDVAVVLDLLRVQQPGTRTFTLDSSNIVLPRGVSLVRSIPSQMRLTFERRVSRSVPVLPRFAGTQESGYEIAKYTVDPPNLKVVGPESRMALLDYAITDPIDLSRVIGTATFTTDAYLGDPHLRFENLESVRVNVVMQKRTER